MINFGRTRGETRRYPRPRAGGGGRAAREPAAAGTVVQHQVQLTLYFPVPKIAKVCVERTFTLQGLSHLHLCAELRLLFPPPTFKPLYI